MTLSQGDSPGTKPYVVIGIDFGTTYSGVSWTWSGNTDYVDQISSWAGGGRTKDSDKVPSRLVYDDLGNIKAWGFETSSTAGHHAQWFKLLLSQDAIEQGGPKVDEMQKLLEKLDKKPVDVVADFLLKLWNHSLKVIELRLHKTALDNMTLRVVITVPANWEPAAQELTKKAAIQAGINAPRFSGPTTLHLVSEPEAAALSAWREAGLHWRPDLKPGDTFVVCDAGGGTVDLISYRVQGLTPFKLEMCVIATGDLCGAVYLDEAFENHMRARIGGATYDKIDERSKAKTFDNDWEHGIKRAFTGDSREFPVDLPGLKPKKQLQNIFRPSAPTTIMLSPGHINAIFQPTCNRVVDLVRQQRFAVEEKMGSPPKIILLVGGFGENDFLQTLLQKTFEEIRVQRPTRAWSAISRGAVLKGLTTSVEDETVTNHIAKFSYGVVYNTEFDPAIHHIADKYLDPISNKYSARSQVQWYLRRGENTRKTEPVKHNWLRRLPSKEALGKTTAITIFYSDAKDPPARLTDDVKKLCVIKTKFDESIFEQLQVQTGAAGQTYRVLDLSINMKVTAAELEWSVKFRNEEKGRAKVEVEYE